MENRYSEEDFNSFVQELIDSDRLEGKELGISKRMLEVGYDQLTNKQKYVFDKAIRNNTVDKCEICCDDISFNEMLEALDNGGYCSHCKNMMEKLEKE
ncbi:hypothetical protein [Prevotella intermedia]|uniref:Uncharacterized protein n=1 Tax=Prevotella intermedia TaxID=28131 RepID=A0A2A6EKZ3_PREIN|nr:hypothetical protein [Prevotella intermedia]PDP67939.1 hypothetical protein CLI70_08415 [Prevotella intermedia]PIN27453.1 hypothetical protein CUC04_08730 [Prevotella intermedia]